MISNLECDALKSKMKKANFDIFKGYIVCIVVAISFFLGGGKCKPEGEPNPFGIAVFWLPLHKKGGRRRYLAKDPLLWGVRFEDVVGLKQGCLQIGKNVAVAIKSLK